ncbi:MAG: photosystem II biogenesis protein Psp29 [Pseudanabaenaceae cyanobacterium]
MNTVRTVADTKRDFYQAFPKPVNSVYRRIVDELLVELHLLRVNQLFVYDQVFALGVVSAFDRFMAGYQPEADVAQIFHALCHGLQFSADQLRHDAHVLNELVQNQPEAVKGLICNLEGDAEPLAGLLHGIAQNHKFKYSRLFGIGLYTLLEKSASEVIADNEQRQALLQKVGEKLNLGQDRLVKDLDLYRSNLEKVSQAQQMMADLVEAERKKREKREASKTEPAETAEPVAVDSDSNN